MEKGAYLEDEDPDVASNNAAVLYLQFFFIFSFFKRIGQYNKPGTALVGAISKAQKDSKTTFSTTGDTKALKKLKIEKKNFRFFFEFFFEVSGKSHSAEKCKRRDAFYLMLDALDALKMKY